MRAKTSQDRIERERRERIARVKQFRAAGMKLQQIADKEGITREWVRRLLNKGES